MNPQAARPEVSVVIASHNYCHFLPDAIRSLLAQTFTDWECIIVDDASVDDTERVVAALVGNDDRFRYVRNERNLGESGSRNVGNSMVTGRLIAVLDADDWWHPEKLQAQVEAMRKVPGAVLCFTSKVEDHGGRQKAWDYDREALEDMDWGLRTVNFVAHSSVLVSKEALESVGGYQTGFSSAEERNPWSRFWRRSGPRSFAFAADWDLWLRVMHHYGPRSLVYIERTLLYYRVHGTSMSSSIDKLGRSEWIVIRRSLSRGGWGFLHPIGARMVIDQQIQRDLYRHVKENRLYDALKKSCVLVAFAPWRRWRWQICAKHARIALAKH